jgi:hypothetical protein
MTEMRPDAGSDEAGQASEYGNDTGFAAEATRTTSPEVDSSPAEPDGSEDPGGLETTTAAGPGDGGD